MLAVRRKPEGTSTSGASPLNSLAQVADWLFAARRLDFPSSTSWISPESRWEEPQSETPPFVPRLQLSSLSSRRQCRASFFPSSSFDTNPKFRSAYTVILRRAFGVAGAGFVDFASPANYRVGWPSGDWGSLPLQGGVEGTFPPSSSPSHPLIFAPSFSAAFKAELDQTASPAERKALLVKLTATLESIRSPLRTAEAFGIEEIIDPRDTRRLACEVR